MHCTGNSCLSQEDEAALRMTADDLLEVHGAGSHPAGFAHPLAIKIMAEIGVDISDRRSKHMSKFLSKPV